MRKPEIIPYGSVGGMVIGYVWVEGSRMGCPYDSARLVSGCQQLGFRTEAAALAHWQKTRGDDADDDL